MVLCFINGAELSPGQVKSAELIIEDNEYRPKLGGRTSATTITVDPSKTPHAIDFTYMAGPQKGQMAKGIYKVAGNDLTICLGLNPKVDRPTEFAAPVDSDLFWLSGNGPASRRQRPAPTDRTRTQAF